MLSSKNAPRTLRVSKNSPLNLTLSPGGERVISKIDKTITGSPSPLRGEGTGGGVIINLLTTALTSSRLCVS